MVNISGLRARSKKKWWISVLELRPRYYYVLAIGSEAILPFVTMSVHARLLSGSSLAITLAPMLVLAAPLAASAEDITFDPKWESGKRYVFTQGMGGKSTMKMGELEMDSDMDAEFVMVSQCGRW